MPTELADASADPDSYTIDVDTACTMYTARYEAFKQTIRSGDLGKTPQFWMIYLDLMKQQHALHISVQENNLEQRLHAWQYFLPYYFAMNKSNYARYGSFYLRSMKSADVLN